MGAGQPGDIKFLSEILSPSIGIITSIGRSHLERLGSEEGVLRVKSELIENIQSGGTAIIPHGKYEQYWKSIRSDIDFITFGFDKDADFQAKIISQTHQNCSFEIKDNLNQLQQKLKPIAWNTQRLKCINSIYCFSNFGTGAYFFQN